MTNIKISQLPLQGNRPEGNDVFPIVDVSTDPNNPVTKKITLSGASQEIVSIGWDVYTGNLFSTGNSININSNLIITGTSLFNNIVTITNNTNLQNSLSISGLTTINNNLVVTGNSTLNTLQVTGNTNLQNTLNVSGLTTINNNLNVTGSTNLQNGLNVTGTTTFSNPVSVNSNATISGDLVVNGNFSYSGLSVTGDTTLTSLNVTNGISAQTITATSISANVSPYYTNRGTITVSANTNTVIPITMPIGNLQLGSTIETYTLFSASTATTIQVSLSTGSTFNLDTTGFLSWGPQSGGTSYQYPCQVKVKDLTTLVSWPVIRNAVNQNSTTAIRLKTIPDITSNEISLNWSFSANSTVLIENLFFEINY
jgi:hypothetical protein